MSSALLSFGGIFGNRPSANLRPKATDPRHETVNGLATRTLSEIDRLVEAAHETSAVSLITVELEVDPGGFGELLMNYLDAPLWDYRDRFFIAPIAKTDTDVAYRIGRLTFEAHVGQLATTIRKNTAFRWGAALRVGGIQVPEGAVADAIIRSPFEPVDAGYLEKLSVVGWATSADLDQLWVWKR
jgi:hypothetical protein